MLTAHRETTTTTRIELDLPGDVLFAMRSFGQADAIQQKVKVALALFLFQEGAISLGKAVELAMMNRLQFIEILQSHGIAAYEYTDQDMAWDQDAVAAYAQAIQS